MKRLLERLANQLFYPNRPSQSFIESLYKYATTITTTAPPIDSLLNEKSQRAFSIYKRLPPSEAVKKLVYVLLCLSDTRTSIEEELRLSIKKAALGFNVPYFRNSEISTLKNKVGYHTYNILHQVYLHSLHYKKLKMEKNAPRSLTHRYFLERISGLLKEYERKVTESEYDFLSFYANMFSVYKKIGEAVRVNDILADKSYLKAKSASSLENNECVELHNLTIKNIDLCTFSPGASNGESSVFSELMQFEDLVYKVCNDCTRSYLLTGEFYDPFGEYFISNHEVDYGLVPPYITTALAERISYIGKYVYFLKSLKPFVPTESIIKTIKSVDLSQKSSANRILEVLMFVNSCIKKEFLEKYKVFSLLDYIYDTFMFGRMDFIDHLFLSLKESRKTSRNSVVYLLDNSLCYTFPDSEFNKMVDIYIKQDNDGLDGGYILSEGFSLYLKLEYPMTVLLEQDFVLKLVYIFKFLWKLKKIDYLSRRIGVLKYISLTCKMMHYVFYEVLTEFKTIKWSDEGLSLDLLRRDINRKLDSIMEKLFINTHAKKIEYLLYYMENAFVKAGKGAEFSDEDIQKSLVEFVNFVELRLENTFLFDIKSFIS